MSHASVSTLKCISDPALHPTARQSLTARLDGVKKPASAHKRDQTPKKGGVGVFRHKNNRKYLIPSRLEAGYHAHSARSCNTFDTVSGLFPVNRVHGKRSQTSSRLFYAFPQ
jgi:hypothetical protein